MKPQNYILLSRYKRKLLREEYIKEQDNKCYWCKEYIYSDPPRHILKLKINWKLFPDNFLENSIHLQHCHKTNMTEGAVHAYCNAVMWQYHNR